MKQIQEQQIEQESWSNLTPQERSQNESQLMHIGRLARYHNIMGTGMIQTNSKQLSVTFSKLNFLDFPYAV